MIFRKLKPKPNRDDWMLGHVHSYFAEAMDRLAKLEVLALSANDILVEDQLTERERMPQFHVDRAKLMKLEKDLLRLELMVDATVLKIKLLIGDNVNELGELRGQFSGKVAIGLGDMKSVSGLEGEAVEVLSSSYLIEEERFPYGELISHREIRKEIGWLRCAFDELHKKVLQ